MNRRLVAAALVLLLLLVGAAAVWRLSRGETPPLVASGSLEARQIRVGSRVSGRVAQVFAQEGDRLEPGQPILTFDPGDTLARRDEAAAALARAEAKLAELRAGPRVEEIAEARAAAQAAARQLAIVREGPREPEIAAARAAAAAAEAEAENAAALASRTEALFREGVVARQRLDDARSRAESARQQAAAARERLRLLEAGSRQAEIEAAEARLAEARARLELLEEGTRPEALAQARADVAAARARLAAAQVAVDELTVRAPAGGPTILEVFDPRPGQLVAAGQPVATLVEPALEVRVFVPEPRLGQVRVGMPVTVLVPAAGRAVTGIVTQIASQAEFTPRTIQLPEDRIYQVFGVKVRLDEEVSRTLRAGMAADVTFDRTALNGAQAPSGGTPGGGAGSR
jgi:multidrug resistance efflux pump